MSTTAMTSRFRVRASVAGAALFGIGLIGAVPASADTITFETIPNHGTPYEGQVISDQYWSQWGIKFKMGDGSNPVIAKVGGPGQGENTTAFNTDDGFATAVSQGIPRFGTNRIGVRNAPPPP